MVQTSIMCPRCKQWHHRDEMVPVKHGSNYRRECLRCVEERSLGEVMRDAGQLSRDITWPGPVQSK
jgi:hypothetical protein